MNYLTNIKQLIGNTPLVKVEHEDINPLVNVFAKLEYFNPGGSVKDRLGINLIESSIKEGKISTKGTLIEPTAGNTGIGLALAAIGTDVKIICVVPQKFSMEKQHLMRALGATVINTPTELGMKGAIEKAAELVLNTPDSYSPQQFQNKNNPKTYINSLGPEIFNALDGKIDVFIAGAGTGGTFAGVSKYFKDMNPNIKSIVVEPEGSILNGGESGPHLTEGIGVEIVPPFFNSTLIDDIYTILDKDAFKRVRELATTSGLLVGSSSGAAFEAVVKESHKYSKPTNIVTIFPDSSERYMSKNIYSEEI
ncbi:MAG: Cysteine synthase [Bacillales bacterium]|jgi:O-acetylserine dependent cystathionine beta-synthase|nr:Cysteine synthase [Bacillales bacterium]